MQNRVYYHGIKADSSNDLLLAKFYKATEITIYDENIGNCTIMPFHFGYELHGSLSSDIKIYANSNYTEYYIVLIHNNNTTHYISIINEETGSNATGLVSGCAETIDLSSLTEVTKTNQKEYPVNRVQTTQITGGTAYEYTSKNLNQTYQAYGSILLITARRSSGVNASGVYLLHKNNENNTSSTYTVTAISENNVSSTFTIAGTSTGVSISSAGNCVFKIVEIYDGKTLN